MKQFDTCIHVYGNRVRGHGVVCRVLAFLPGGPVSIPGENLNFYPGAGCVSFVCLLPCVVSNGGPDIVLTRNSGMNALVYLYSVMVHSLLLPLQVSDPWTFGL